MFSHCTNAIILLSTIHVQSCTANDLVCFDPGQNSELVDIGVPVQPDAQRRLDEVVRQQARRRVFFQSIGP